MEQILRKKKTFSFWEKEALIYQTTTNRYKRFDHTYAAWFYVIVGGHGVISWYLDIF